MGTNPPASMRVSTTVANMGPENPASATARQTLPLLFWRAAANRAWQRSEILRMVFILEISTTTWRR